MSPPRSLHSTKKGPVTLSGQINTAASHLPVSRISITARKHTIVCVFYVIARCVLTLAEFLDKESATPSSFCTLRLPSHFPVRILINSPKTSTLLHQSVITQVHKHRSNVT